MPDATASSAAGQIIAVLEPLLGPHTARRALSLVCERLRKSEEQLALADLPLACETLRPILRTLAGKDVANRVLRELGGQPG